LIKKEKIYQKMIELKEMVAGYKTEKS